MKKIVGASLFIFLAAVAAIIITGLFLSPKNPTVSEQSLLLPSGEEILILDSQEVAKHNSQSDCWMIIDNKVYNFTNYLNGHPGGSDSMVLYCGKDGSQGFATKDKNKAQSHSTYADSLLSGYYIGNLGQTATIQQIQQNIDNAIQTAQPLRRDSDDGDDD